MSRTFLKDSLYYYAVHNEQAKKKELEAEKQRKNLDKMQAMEDAKNNLKSMKKGNRKAEKAEEAEYDFNAEDALKLQVHEKKAEVDIDIDEEMRNLFANPTKTKSQSSQKSLAWIPKSSLKPVQKNEDYKEKMNQRQQWQRQRKQKQQMWKLRQQLIKAIKQENNEPNNNNSNDPNKQQNQEIEQQTNEKQKEKEKAKTTGKKKKIKKQANYVKTDLKRRYKDRFVGGINKNLRQLTKGGKMKSSYLKSKLQSELEISEGQVYNSYIISLSKALFVTIKLEDSDDQSSSQEQQLKYTVPTTYTKENLEKLIFQLFGFTSFREGQFETISNILEGKSTLFVSETASGKSMTYLLASVILKGLSIVVSPLVSLMLDQIEHLPRDLPAACISSLLNHEQKDRILKMVKQGKIQILYITPQSFLTDFMYHVRQFPAINFVCVDQAHSLSQLSHSFRASYLSLEDIILKYFKYKKIHPVVLCLTATANIQTMQSICQKLHINETIRSRSVINKNLFVTISREGLTVKCEGLLHYLQQPQIKRCKGVLVYCRTKKIMFDVFNYLRNSAEICFIYHSGLPQKEKVETLEKFRRGQIRIVIATVALGMGLDFENLECVIHINMPKSVENYIQEIGRAGRRNKRAYCHLFLDKYDYYTQRNYFLADELQPRTFHEIINILKTNFVQGKHRKNEKKNNNKNTGCIQQTENLKRLCLEDKDKDNNENENGEMKEQNMGDNYDDEQIYDEDEEQKKPQSQPCQPEPENSKSKQSVEKAEKAENAEKEANDCQENCEDQWKINELIQFLPLAYCKADLITQKSGLKQEAILNILLKIQKNLGRKVFKVLPMSSETLKLSFFKKNEEDLKKQSHFYNKLVANCKNLKGIYYIPLIRKCNQLKMTPIRLLSEVYGLSNNYCLKIELTNQVFVWQHQKSAKHTFQLLDEPSNFNKIMKQFNLVQRTALTKFNIFYSLAFDHSMKTMHHIIQRKQIISTKDPLPSRSILHSFDDYFKQETYQFYKCIANESNVDSNALPQGRQQEKKGIQAEGEVEVDGENGEVEDNNEAEIMQNMKSQEAAYLPITIISPDNLVEIQQNVDLFLKHVLMNNPNKLFTQNVLPYRDGRVIARVFMGVNDTNSNWKTYGEHPYWMKFIDKDYRSLLTTVRKCVTDFIQREGPRMLAAEQLRYGKSTKKQTH